MPRGAGCESARGVGSASSSVSASGGSAAAGRSSSSSGHWNGVSASRFEELFGVEDGQRVERVGAVAAPDRSLPFYKAEMGVDSVRQFLWCALVRASTARTGPFGAAQ